MILGAVESVLMILILVFVGYFAARMGWVSKGSSRFIIKLLFNVTLPCTIVYSFLANFTSAELLRSGKYILAAFCGVLVYYLAGWCVSRIARIPKGQRGVFTVLFSFSNSAFVGFPVALAIFGEKGMAYAVFYFLANTVSFNTMGYLHIAGDGKYLCSRPAELAQPAEDAEVSGHAAQKAAGSAPAAARRRENMAGTVARVLQPPVLSVFAAIALVLLDVRLPMFASTTLSYLSGITSPLSLLFVGIILSKAGLASLRFDKKMLLVMAGRFAGAPLAMLGICMLLAVESFPSQVMITQMALPTMVAAVIYSEATGADSSFAARGMVLSTLLSFAVLPVLVVLLSQ